jgi:hypothetical protein
MVRREALGVRLAPALLLLELTCARTERITLNALGITQGERFTMKSAIIAAIVAMLVSAGLATAHRFER